MKILITGSKGMLGSDIVKEFKNFDLYSFDKDELDITKTEEINKTLQKIKPDIVINCAAYTDVDGSESDKEIALEINADSVKNLAQACRKINSVFVHFSTDYVFDGSNKNGYRENGKKNPVSYYGYTKSLGEDYIRQELKNYYIIRTSWLFGKKGRNFIEAIIKKSKEKEIKVVNDQTGSPTYTKDLAKAVKELITKNYDYGIYHITNSGYCTWFDFAKEILKQKKSNAKVAPITSKELNLAAKRPKCSILINTKFKNKLPFWNIALKRYLGEN